MQLIPILVVEDHQAALDFYRKAFQATQLMTFGETTQLRVQDQIFAVRKADETTRGGETDNIVLLIQTAAPDVVQQEAIKHGADIIAPVEDRKSGVRAGRFRDPFGIQWIVSTKHLQ